MSAPFNYLTGVIRIDQAAPSALLDRLIDFYVEPNREAWMPLCRILYHESVHFWQLLASGYLANVVADEWSRLERYEQTGELLSRGAFASKYLERVEPDPFSAYELVECWARYWDVHTRSPAAILEDDTVPAGFMFPGDTKPSYTSRIFDRVMQVGPDSALYAAPYRWALERADGDSHFVAVTFPILTHHAFGAKRPVKVFLEAFELALEVHRRRELLHRTSILTANINLSWLNNWSSIVGQALQPTLAKLGEPSFTSGFDVIARGALRSHPVYPHYLKRTQLLTGRLRLLEIGLPRILENVPPFRHAEYVALVDLARRSPWVIFALPGQPDYRSILGASLTPPRVIFGNGIVDLDLRLLREHASSEHASSQIMDDTARRVVRFAAAEKAASLGLPANAFE